LHNIIRENRYMRKSQVTTAVLDHIKHDLVHQPLQLLMGINLLGMTSSTLGTMSRGAANLSKDSGYLQMRSNQEKARRVRGVCDGVLQGTSTFARGVTYGFKGIVTKPAEGVRTKGVMGAFQGFAKAIVGVIVQPISGCLDFGALMVSGVGTSCTHCFAAIEQEPTFERSRLPRAIQGKVLTPYDEHSARGQAILHLVQSRFLGKDVFRERGQSSHSDYYQAHFYLPQDFILLLTNRHVSMLKPPAAHARDRNKELTNPRTIEWKVRWEKLVNPFSSLPGSSSSSLVQLHCQDASNQFTKIIECFQPAEESGNSQALQICEAIQHYQRLFCSEVLPTAKVMDIGFRVLCALKLSSIYPCYQTVCQFLLTSQSSSLPSIVMCITASKSLFLFQIVPCADGGCAVGHGYCPTCGRQGDCGQICSSIGRPTKEQPWEGRITRERRQQITA
jgi:vacuolar protein sorting-associated protein 13A/C